MPAKAERCCLCGRSIRKDPEDVPLDDDGNAILPPGCLAAAQKCNAPDTGKLGNEKGHWCYIKVTKERSDLRSQRTLRGGYNPGPALPHVAAPRVPKIEDLTLTGSLPLAYVAGVTTEQGGGSSDQQALDERAAAPAHGLGDEPPPPGDAPLTLDPGGVGGPSTAPLPQPQCRTNGTAVTTAMKLSPALAAVA